MILKILVLRYIKFRKTAHIMWTKTGNVSIYLPSLCDIKIYSFYLQIFWPIFLALTNVCLVTNFAANVSEIYVSV